MVNYYELLGVGRDCPPDELKKAYKKAALKHHPDKGGNAEMFKEVSLAYETLNDEAKRLLYDRTTFGSLYGGSGMSGAGGLGTNFGPPNMGPSATATSSRPPMPKKPPPGGTGTSSTSGAAGRSGSGAGPPPGRASRAPPNLEEMSIRELKELLTQLGIRSDDCFERAELISKVKAHFPLDSSGPSTTNGDRDQPYHQQPPFRGQAWDAGKYQSMTEATASDLHGNTAVLSTSRVKVISMGASNSGKSCLIKRFCEGRFVPRYISTIGVDYGVKTVFIQPPAAMPNSNGRNREQKQRIKVNFFDLSGHDDFRDIRVDFYENTQGVLLCYDASNVETFKKLQSTWMWESRTHGLNFSDAVCLLCANKCDLASRQVSKSEGQQFAAENGFHYFELSSQTGDNVVQAFNLLFEKIIMKLAARKQEVNNAGG